MTFLIPFLTLAASASPSLSDIEGAVQVHAAERLQAMGHEVRASDIEIASLGLRNAPDCPEGSQFTVSSSPAERFLGHAEFTLHWSHQGEPCANLRVNTRLIVHTLVPVAAEPANPGQFVKIEAARVPLHALAGTPIEPDTSNRWIARTTLATGTALTTARVKSAPDADTGADIELVAISGTIAIRAPGRLLAAARIGDTVRVANLATNKVVEGTLISPQSVRISR